MEFERIDDFSRYLNLQDGQALGRSFQYLVDRHFDYIEKENGSFEENSDDLLICFLELTTLVEQEVIGETFLRSHMKKNGAKNFINKYKKIVDRVKKDPSCISSISGYEKWYRMGTFFLMVANNNAPELTFETVSSWDGQPPGTIMDFNKKRDLYATSDDEIDEQDVKKYLSLYYDLLTKELEFGTYPNVCVIVKPISVTDGESHIPLGNLYLHFATRSPKTKAFYLRFINDFMRVWYYEKGYEIITEIERFAVTEAIENDEILSYRYRPVFNGQKKGRLGNNNLFKNNSLGDYFDELYSDWVARKAFEERLYSTAQSAINLFHEIRKKESIEQPTILEIDKLRSLFVMTLVKKLFTEYNMEHFIQILIYREIYKIGVLVFTFDPLKLHYDLTSNNGFDPSYHANGGSTMARLSDAMWTNRLIPCVSTGNYDAVKLVNGIRKCLCEVELQYLERYNLYKQKLDINYSS